MSTGTFHDPVHGESFTAEVQSGEYTVNNDGTTITYFTVEGSDKSQCTCPICSKVFDVDLVADRADYQTDASLEFNDEDNLINFYMVI